MVSIAHADYPRAICNWRPSDRKVAVFKPSLVLEEERITRPRTFNGNEEPTVGRGGGTVFKKMKMHDYRKQRKLVISAHDIGGVGLELTAEGPTFFDRKGILPELKACVDIEDIDPAYAQKIATCSELVEESRLRVFNLSVNMRIGNEWIILHWSRRVPYHLQDKSIRELLVLAHPSFFDYLSDKAKNYGYGNIVFAPSEEMKRLVSLDIFQVRDERLKDRFGIKSGFRVSGHYVEVSTVYTGTRHHPYETLIFVTTADGMHGKSVGYYQELYDTEAEAEKGHWEITGIVKRGAPKFMDELAETLKEAQKEAA